MTITLTATQRAWIAERIAAGEFASEEDAMRQLLDEGIVERAIAGGDLSWAKPYVDVALAQAARGEVLSMEEFHASIDEMLAGLTG